MIHIGVTGHRFLAEIPKLQAGIDQALARIAQAYPGKDWSVLSSLADGADRLVVQRVLLFKPDTSLIVPLPLPVSDFRQDFSSQLSRLEFDILLARAVEVIPAPQVTSRSEGYWLAGLTLLGRIDVLVALWDGKEARGPGGTEKIVATARQRMLPLAWVKCGNLALDTNEAVSLGEEQGQVILERI